MAFAKFKGNQFRIDGEIAENHTILVMLCYVMLIYCWASVVEDRPTLKQHRLFFFNRL